MSVLMEDSEKKIKDTLEELISIQSDTGTSLEKDVEKYLYDWLQKLDYFKSNTNNSGSYPLKNDSLERAVVWGLVKGVGRKTVILLNHHDVVDTYDYQTLKTYAYQPALLREMLKNVELAKDVEEDLISGEWIFARGAADMKAGIAIQLSIIEEFSKQQNFNGNILFISVADEESLSLGMRSSAELLKKIKNKFDLEYTMLIDSEPHQKTENNEGVFYTGSVGKLMPVVYVRGKKTHIGDIFQGFNPLLLLSQIASETELNSDFSDVVENEVSPPPSWNYFRDGKKCYDASIPDSAGGYFSVLTLKRTPKIILEQLLEISKQTFEDVICKMNKSYSNYLNKKNEDEHKLPWKTNVKTFSQIYNDAIEQSGEKFLLDYNLTIDKLKIDIKNNIIGMPESNMALIGKTLEYITDKTPMVVIAFSPPYYPHISINDFKELDNNVSDIGNAVVRIAREVCYETYSKRNYFMGISDMSYAALNESENVIPHIEFNMPLWKNMYDIPFETIKQLNIPSINIGPYGKDLHKFTERVFTLDVIRQTPRLINGVIEYVLKNN
ncbi:M20/M25/M40 family metallo-hydrolase [Clostridium estertheticum]|uniref:M20/M25/M40 family metallo-hydrolase n=1 Tax=Clostridium estertheticum TaxID=238834 RepID=UPI001CF38939|nr:M20/M25/M40 family metallo-hydrolase [Clostridium estertheticum]MCB2307921.1 M20/M25/M40 family metallo-hydrolase [Clostridium estertheticum]MCB2346045.1 M20/M25/M40 family metallo-hydrolase [Clostridium estertheticum]MCB2351303.1 M20/M25/M40 family metallo-hydrolase [Clostridium estertheticum]WAG44191.1 M20/M25/M40 family metallo-hydrolase [Clostridium estertheticum]